MNYFFCTKPFQFFNCLNIASALNKEDCVLFVVSNFFNSEEFYCKLIERQSIWRDIHLIKNKKGSESYGYIIGKTDNVYLDSDMHRDLVRIGVFKKAKINVYEEGLSVYTRKTVNVTNSKFKNQIINLLTILGLFNSRQGGARKTEKIYLYNKEKYIENHPDLACKAIPFPSLFIDNYLANRELLDYVFDVASIRFKERERILLFLTANIPSYNYLEDFENISKCGYDQIIFKPHPNIGSSYLDKSSYSLVMTEILLMKMLADNCTVDVYHYGSSTKNYITDKRINYKEITFTVDMNKLHYDYVIFTNIPSFYKINLYNKLNEIYKIKVIFFSKKSEIREGDFNSNLLSFEHCFLSAGNYENRNKFKTFFKVVSELKSINYNYIIYPGWELIELVLLSFITPKKSNCIAIESSIRETRTRGLPWKLKKLILSRFSIAFPSGILQEKILEKAKFTGVIKMTHGVGIPHRNTERKFNVGKVQKDLCFLYVGRLSPEKNLDLLVNTFNKLGLTLTIVGNGAELERLQELAGPNIVFKGYINNADLPSIYLTHDVFILPSISEPWGLVIDEALWFGLPVIVSDNVGCLEDLVINEKSGVVFNHQSKHALLEAIHLIQAKYYIYKNNVISIDFLKRDIIQLEAYDIKK